MVPLRMGVALALVPTVQRILEGSEKQRESESTIILEFDSFVTLINE